jgi:streptomycin 6-kinase
MISLPLSFIETIRSTFQEDGEKYLANLPALIEEASRRWELTEIQPVTNLSYNFVAFARQVSIRPKSTDYSTGKQDVVLKIGVPRDELSSEMEALKLFNGEGACQLLGFDEEKGFLLLERLTPGRMLAEIENDDERTNIAAEVMQKIWRTVTAHGGVPAAEDGDGSKTDGLPLMQEQTPALHKFIKLTHWFDGLKKIRPYFNGGLGPFPKKLLEQVESFLPELFTDTDVKLLHGDFHHFNILSSERGWLIIDPKGVIGPAGYEVGPLMMNPWNESMDGSRFEVHAKRRVDILSERLDWEREKIIRWSMAHAILSAWWGIEDGTGWEYSVRCAEIFSALK